MFWSFLGYIVTKVCTSARNWLGSPDCFSSWEGGVWGRDYLWLHSTCIIFSTSFKFYGVTALTLATPFSCTLSQRELCVTALGSIDVLRKYMLICGYFSISWRPNNMLSSFRFSTSGCPTQASNRTHTLASAVSAKTVSLSQTHIEQEMVVFATCPGPDWAHHAVLVAAMDLASTSRKVFWLSRTD